MITNTSQRTYQNLLAISTGFLLIHLLGWGVWSLYVSVGVGVLGLLSVRLAGVISFLWMKLAVVLGYIIPPLILVVLFYGLLFPLAVIARIFGRKDPLMLKRNVTSTFRNRDTQVNADSFEKVW